MNDLIDNVMIDGKVYIDSVDIYGIVLMSWNYENALE